MYSLQNSPKWIIRTIGSFIFCSYPFTPAGEPHKAQDHRAGPQRKLVQYHTALHVTVSVCLFLASLGVWVHQLLCSRWYLSYSRAPEVFFPGCVKSKTCTNRGYSAFNISCMSYGFRSTGLSDFCKYTLIHTFKSNKKTGWQAHRQTVWCEGWGLSYWLCK